MNNKRKDLFKTVVSGIGGQLVAVALGLLIPRIMISVYGSDVNGVISTTVQIFSFLALLEAGIGQSARIALYKPISQKDKLGISAVYSSAQLYFRKMTLYYGVGVVAISLLTPYVIKSEMTQLTIFLVFILEGMSGVISFYYIQTPTIFLNAYGKGYVNNNVNLVNRLLGYLAKIMLALMGTDIVLVQLSFFIITVVKVFFYRTYINKKYSWIIQVNTSNISLLSDRNSYLLTEIAWTIFSSTDIIVLSVFVGASLSSVYSVYNLIYANISFLLNAVAGGTLYILGHFYHENLQEYEIIHDVMNTLFIGSITVLMSVSYVLTIPFVNLYIGDVADVNYVYNQLPLAFCLVQLLSWSRYVNGNLTGLAGYAQSTSYISIVEAIVNFFLSVFLVQKHGIIGVIYATVIALPIKVLWCAYISDIKVLHRSCINTVKIFGCNYGFFFCVVLMMNEVHIDIQTYGMLVLYGALFSFVFGLLVLCLNIFTNRSCLHVYKRYVSKR